MLSLPGPDFAFKYDGDFKVSGVPIFIEQEGGKVRKRRSCALDAGVQSLLSSPLLRVLKYRAAALLGVCGMVQQCSQGTLTCVGPPCWGRTADTHMTCARNNLGQHTA